MNHTVLPMPIEKNKWAKNDNNGQKFDKLIGEAYTYSVYFLWWAWK